MEWIILDKNNIPEDVVLAGNFEPFTYGYKEKCIGLLYERNGLVECENEHEVLENVTHYIDINRFDPEPGAAV